MKKLFLTTTLVGLTILASGVAHAGSGEDILGTAADDNIIGTDNGEDIFGGTGADRITGFSGHDRIYGGGGADTIVGGAGRDKVWGQYGADTIDSGAPQKDSHTEVQNGGSGKDTCYSGDYTTGEITYSSCKTIKDGYLPF